MTAIDELYCSTPSGRAEHPVLHILKHFYPGAHVGGSGEYDNEQIAALCTAKYTDTDQQDLNPSKIYHPRSSAQTVGLDASPSSPCPTRWIDNHSQWGDDGSTIGQHKQIRDIQDLFDRAVIPFAFNRLAFGPDAEKKEKKGMEEGETADTETDIIRRKFSLLHGVI